MSACFSEQNTAILFQFKEPRFLILVSQGDIPFEHACPILKRLDKTYCSQGKSERLRYRLA